jgi:hypothetical protein
MTWRERRCIQSPRFSTRVSFLYRDFTLWCERNNDWPCEEEQFTRLLRLAGTRLYSIGSLLLASGIGLVADVNAYREM